MKIKYTSLNFQYKLFIHNLREKSLKNMSLAKSFYKNPEITGIGFSIFPSCNLNCEYCYAKDFRESVFLKNYFKETSKKTILNLKAALKHLNIQKGGLFVRFQPNGESMLFQQFLLDFLTTLLKTGVKIKGIGLETNGTIPISKSLSDLLIELKRAGSSLHFTISFDGNGQITKAQRGVDFIRISQFVRSAEKLGIDIIDFNHTWTKRWIGFEQEVISFIKQNYENYFHKISINTKLDNSDLEHFYCSLKKLVLFSKIYGVNLRYNSENITEFCRITDKMFFHYPYISGCPFYDPSFDSIYLSAGVPDSDIKTLRRELIHTEFFEDERNNLNLKSKEGAFYLERINKLLQEKDFPDFCKNCPFFEFCNIKFCPFLRKKIFKTFCEKKETLKLRFIELINFDKSFFPLVSVDEDCVYLGYDFDLNLKKISILKASINLFTLNTQNLDYQYLLSSANDLNRLLNKNSDVFVFLKDVLEEDNCSLFYKKLESLFAEKKDKILRLFIWYPRRFPISDILKKRLKQKGIYLIPKDELFFRCFVIGKKIFCNGELIQPIDDVSLDTFPILP